MRIGKDSERDRLASGEQQLVATDFWAPLCPCCTASNLVFELVLHKEQDIKFVRANADQLPDSASNTYETQAVPVVKFFSESKEIGECAAYTPKDNLDIDKMVARSASSCLASLSPTKQSASNTISIVNGGEAE